MATDLERNAAELLREIGGYGQGPDEEILKKFVERVNSGVREIDELQKQHDQLRSQVSTDSPKTY